MGMTNDECINQLISLKNHCMDMHTDLTDVWENDIKALNVAIKAVERIGHLIDRPCEACEYHKETGCSQWSCVFEEVKADEDSD